MAAEKELTIWVYAKDLEIMNGLKVHPREPNKEVFHRIVDIARRRIEEVKAK